MRHSVIEIVNAMYTITAANVIATNRQSNFANRTAATRVNSSTTGMIENSMYDSSVEMPRVPRSMSRDTPPVWRSR